MDHTIWFLQWFLQFDGCIGPQAEQQIVMQKVDMKKLLDKVLEGYSSTVMACGQTGSGKTYTMSGREEVGLCDFLLDYQGKLVDC